MSCAAAFHRYHIDLALEEQQNHIKIALASNMLAATSHRYHFDVTTVSQQHHLAITLSWRHCINIASVSTSVSPRYRSSVISMSNPYCIGITSASLKHVEVVISPGAERHHGHYFHHIHATLTQALQHVRFTKFPVGNMRR